MSNDKNVLLKVSASQEEGYCKKVAGAISWRLRESGFCRLRAIKEEAVNSAVKALAIVNSRLDKQEKKLIFCFDPIFESVKDDSEKRSLAVAMKITEVFDNEPPPPVFVEYKVSSKRDDYDKLAGAIAAPVREGKGVRLRCIGKLSTYKCVYSSVLAKGYLWSYGINSIMVPTWHSIQSDKSNTGQISAIQIDFYGIQNVDEDEEETADEENGVENATSV